MVTYTNKQIRPARLWRVGDALSQCLNVCLFDGDANESVSGRCYRLKDKHRGWRFGYHTVNTIFFFQENHCKEAYMNDVYRAYEVVRVYELSQKPVQVPV